MAETKNEQPKKKDLLTLVKEKLPNNDSAYVQFGKETHSSNQVLVDFGDHFKMYKLQEGDAVVEFDSKSWASLPSELTLDKYFLRLVYRTQSGSPAFVLSRPDGQKLMDKIEEYSKVEVLERKWYQKIYGFRSRSRFKSIVAVGLYASALFFGSAVMSSVGEYFSGDNEVAVVSESSASEKVPEVKKEAPKKQSPAIAESNSTASKEATERAEAIRNGDTSSQADASAGGASYEKLKSVREFKVSNLTINDHMGLGDGSKIALFTLDKVDGDATYYRKLAQLATVDLLKEIARTEDVSELVIFYEYKSEGPYIKYTFEPNELEPLLKEIRSGNSVLFGDVEARATDVMMNQSLK